MNNFRIGQKVICVDCEFVDGLILNKIYAITKVNPNSVYVDGIGGYFPERFKCAREDKLKRILRCQNLEQ